MPTTSISLTPADGWVTLFTAPADTAVSVEKINGGSPAVLAIGTIPPAGEAGHSLNNNAMKTAVLKAGESLYALCTDDLTAGGNNVFVITG